MLRGLTIPVPVCGFGHCRRSRTRSSTAAPPEPTATPMSYHPSDRRPSLPDHADHADHARSLPSPHTGRARGSRPPSPHPLRTALHLCGDEPKHDPPTRDFPADFPARTDAKRSGVAGWASAGKARRRRWSTSTRMSLGQRRGGRHPISRTALRGSCVWAGELAQFGDAHLAQPLARCRHRTNSLESTPDAQVRLHPRSPVGG